MRRQLPTGLALLLAGCAGAPPHGPDRYGPPPHPPGDHPPGHARLFVSPMGEPFRGEGDVAPDALWFAAADTDHDGRLTPAEFQADAARFFATLDSDHDGEIGPEEIERYENEILPEVHIASAGGGTGAAHGQAGGGGGHHRGGGGGMGGGGRGHSGDGAPGGSGAQAQPGEAPRQGAARFSYLDIPEPVIAADTDMNRGVSRAEFLRAAAQRFALLDTAQAGVLTRATLPPLPHGHAGGPQGHRRPPPG